MEMRFVSKRSYPDRSVWFRRNLSSTVPSCRHNTPPHCIGEALTDRLRAAHVVAGLDPVYGGPSYTVPRLCEALAAAGAEVILLWVAEKERPARHAPCWLPRSPLSLK